MIRIQEEDFDVADIYAFLRQAKPTKTGAICVFTGLVREFGDHQDVEGLFLEHYAGMTEKSLSAIVEQAKARWKIHASMVIHRVGHLALTEQIVAVGVSAAHREDAFLACQFIMDYLKRDAPIWKKERHDGQAFWVDAKQSDKEKAASWDSAS